jgi:hypothetical protein
MKIGFLIVKFFGSICEVDIKKIFANLFGESITLQIISIISQLANDYSLSIFAVSNFSQDTLI